MKVGLLGHRRLSFLLRRLGRLVRLGFLRRRRARAGSKSSFVRSVPEHPKARFFARAEVYPLLNRFFRRRCRTFPRGMDSDKLITVPSPLECIPFLHRGAGRPVSALGRSYKRLLLSGFLPKKKIDIVYGSCSFSIFGNPLFE